MTLEIIHLSTYDIEGGAARAAYRQHRALIAEGINSKMLVRFKNSTDETVEVFCPSTQLIRRLKRVAVRHYLQFRQTSLYRKSVNSKISGPLTDPRSETLTNLDNSLSEKTIIHIHQVENFVDLVSLFSSLPQNIPIVLTLHDLNLVTGGCAYPFQCCKFETSCGHCPVILSPNSNDVSTRIQNWKKRAYEQRTSQRLTFVANSHWTLKKATQSSLLSQYSCQMIHYGLDTNIYNTQKRKIARQALGLPQSQPILLFSAHNVADERKGGKYIVKALEDLNPSYDPFIVTFGKGKFPIENYQSLHFDRVDNERFQSLLYQAANVFIMPSIEEAFGQTALEAIACGTVVAGFAIGGIPDIVVNGLNGIIVPVGNVSELRKAILDLLDDVLLRQHWVHSAEIWTNERFSYKVNALKYIELYQKMLE